jgi:hypothetical protein
MDLGDVTIDKIREPGRVRFVHALRFVHPVHACHGLSTRRTTLFPEMTSVGPL